MAERRRFTPEFKRQAVQLLNAGQRPAAELARELGIPRNRLYKWRKDVAAHGGAFPGSVEAKGSGIFSCNCARRKLNQTFRFFCRVSRTAARNNSEDPPFPFPPAF